MSNRPGLQQSTSSSPSSVSLGKKFAVLPPIGSPKGSRANASNLNDEGLEFTDNELEQALLEQMAIREKLKAMLEADPPPQ